MCHLEAYLVRAYVCRLLAKLVRDPMILQILNKKVRTKLYKSLNLCTFSQIHQNQGQPYITRTHRCKRSHVGSQTGHIEKVFTLHLRTRYRMSIQEKTGR